MGFSVGAIAERLSQGVDSFLLVSCFSWELDTHSNFLTYSYDYRIREGRRVTPQSTYQPPSPMTSDRGSRLPTSRSVRYVPILECRCGA
jgi:hypothetical protein